MTTHTPAPWVASEDCIYGPGWEEGEIAPRVATTYVADGDEKLLSHEEALANAKRITECVNACDGLIDPETMVPALFLALHDLVAQCQRYAENDDSDLPYSAFAEVVLDVVMEGVK